MEFVKGSTNLDTRLEMPVKSYLPGDDSEGNIMMKVNDGVYGYKEKTDGLLVSTFTGAGLWYSEDNGNNWQQSNIDVGTWNVAYANGVLIAQTSSYSSGIRRSIDGKTWSIVGVGTGNAQCSAVYGKGVWVSAVDLRYSTNNGESWTQVSGISQIKSLVFANDIFLATSVNSNYLGIWRSTDGINWTRVYSTRGIQNVAYGESVWIAALDGASTGKTLLRSTDNGLTWSEITNSPDSTTSRYFRNMLYTDGVWIAAINSGYSGIYISTDNGVTFRQTRSSGNYNFIVKHGDITVVGGRMYIDGANKDVILYSKDNGVSWPISDWVVDPRRPNACVWAGDRFVVTTDSYGAWYSFDGIHWTQSAKTTGSGHTSMYSIVYQSGDWEKLVNFIGDHKGFIGEVKPSIGPQNDSWLLCDGSIYDISKYSGLYAILGTNVLPDFREVIPVAIGQQGDTRTLPTGHDVFTLGQIKDRNVTNHKHNDTQTAHSHNITAASHNHTPTKWNWGNGLAGDRDYELRWFDHEVSANTETVSIALETGAASYPNSPSVSTFGSGVFRVKSYGVNYYIRAKY